MCVYYRRPTICCLSRSQSPHFFLIYNLSHSTIYHQIFNMIYRAGVTSRAGTVYPSGTSKCTLVFGGILDIQSFCFLCSALWTVVVLIVYFILTIGIVCTFVLRLLVTLCRPLLSLLSIFYWLVLSVPQSYDFWLHFGIFKLSFRKWVKISTFHSILWIKDLSTHTYSI
jgi:hypothetical protein